MLGGNVSAYLSEGQLQARYKYGLKKLMLKKVLENNKLEMFLRFDLLGAKQTVHLVRFLTFAQFLSINENVFKALTFTGDVQSGGSC